MSLGTQTDNNRDMWRKNRGGFGERNCHHKLTATQVKEIMAAKGKEHMSDLAYKYGVKDGAIYSIWNGRSWSRLFGDDK